MTFPGTNPFTNPFFQLYTLMFGLIICLTNRSGENFEKKRDSSSWNKQYVKTKKLIGW